MHRLSILIFISYLSIVVPHTPYAETCETDGPDGRWIEITDIVPEGECLDTTFIRRYNSGGIYARYYLEGKSDKYRVLIPTSPAQGCTTYNLKECDCNEWQENAVSSDAYNDCWGIADRCSGTTCRGYSIGESVPPPECTNCWSVGCWQIAADNNDHRRRVFEWVCDNSNITPMNNIGPSCPVL